MSTATAPSTSTEPEIAVTADLWREYRKQRAERQQERPSVAADRALDACRIHKGDSRNRLSRLLEERETERGLRPDPGERRDDEALAAAARAAETQVEHEKGSVAAIRRDAQQKIPQLEAARSRLVFAALTDAGAKAELLDVESELVEARRAEEWADLAEAVAAEEAVEAAEQAEQEARKNAAVAAVKLEPGIAKRKSEIDRLLALAASETRGLADMQQTYNAHRAAAGVDPFNLKATAFRPAEIESAVAFHFEGTGVFRGPGRNYPLMRTEAKQ